MVNLVTLPYIYKYLLKCLLCIDLGQRQVAGYTQSSASFILRWPGFVDSGNSCEARSGCCNPGGNVGPLQQMSFGVAEWDR